MGWPEQSHRASCGVVLAVLLAATSSLAQPAPDDAEPDRAAPPAEGPEQPGDPPPGDPADPPPPTDDWPPVDEDEPEPEPGTEPSTDDEPAEGEPPRAGGTDPMKLPTELDVPGADESEADETEAEAADPEAIDVDAEADGAPVVPIDVLVEGHKPMDPGRAAGQQSFKRREVERLPGAFGDALRAVEVLPGVTPLVSGLPHFAVRGALPSATGYYLDGIRVPFLYHLGAGPSVIHPVLVHGVEFYPGPYPSRFGQHVGGIISARTPPPAYRVRGQANIRVFDASAFLEVPIADGQADAFAAGRYSYTAAILSLFTPTTELGYWDYQAGGGLALTSRDRLRLFSFGSHDYLGEVDGDTEKELFGAEFHRINLRLDHAAPKSIRGTPAAELEPRARAGATLGYDRTGLGQEGVMSVLSLAVRGDGELPFSKWFRLRLGAEANIDAHQYEPYVEPALLSNNAPAEEDEEFIFDLSEAFVPDRTHTLGGYVDLVLRPIPELEIVPGLRADVFAEAGFSTMGLDPRASIRGRPVEWLTTITAVGVAHQRPAIVLAVPGLDPRALAGGLQEVKQISQGVELALPLEIEATVTGFYHTYRNLTDLTATCTADVGDCSVADRADGSSYGVELTVRRSLTERVGGLVSYTLSRAVREVDQRTTLSDFDRTHVLHVVLGVDLTRGWHIGARLSAYSGRPHSIVSFDDPSDPQEATLVGKRNALRRPVFHRLDARIEKRWTIEEAYWISLVLEGMNVTLQKEIVDFDCRVAEALGGRGGLTCGGQEIGPITIPSLGVSGGF